MSPDGPRNVSIDASDKCITAALAQSAAQTLEEKREPDTLAKIQLPTEHIGNVPQNRQG